MLTISHKFGSWWPEANSSPQLRPQQRQLAVAVGLRWKGARHFHISFTENLCTECEISSLISMYIAKSKIKGILWANTLSHPLHTCTNQWMTGMETLDLLWCPTDGWCLVPPPARHLKVTEAPPLLTRRLARQPVESRGATGRIPYHSVPECGFEGLK